MEWRARLEIDYAQKLSRQAEKYRQILSSDPYLPLQSTFVTSLEKTHEFAESLTLCQVSYLFLRDVKCLMSKIESQKRVKL